MASPNSSGDVEKNAADSGYVHLTNGTLHNFSWDNVSVTVKDRSTKQPLDILSGVSGFIEAGKEMFDHTSQM